MRAARSRAKGRTASSNGLCKLKTEVCSWTEMIFKDQAKGKMMGNVRTLPANISGIDVKLVTRLCLDRVAKCDTNLRRVDNSYPRLDPIRALIGTSEDFNLVFETY